ncbi:MAG: glycosyltransferase family 39 protein [Acidimicrobiia bacterium]|nr:glycosyltransferase family 39 protein [Acidimicrobiia bacterium]
MRRPVLTLILLSLLTFFFGLGRPAISDSDEAFYAEASREMVQSGDWLTPHFNYTDRWQKPVLYYWLSAAAYLVSGPTEWAARVWSALAGLGLVLVTWHAGRRFGNAAAWLAGAIVGTCYGYFAMARLALPDLPLAFCITVTIWAVLEQRWVLAGTAAALGFLFKGPVALAVPAIVLVPIWWRERRTFPLRATGLLTAAAVFLVIGLPWYVAMTATHGTAYLDSFFVGDNFERFATDRFNDPRPIWFYGPILAGGMLPWSMYGYLLFRRDGKLTNDEWRLLLWALVPIVFFTISIGKQPRYILPVLPPLAILLARALVSEIEGAVASGGSRKSLSIGTWLTALLYAVLAVLLYRARPIFISVAPWVSTFAIGVIAAAGLAIAGVAASRTWHRLPVVLPASAVVLLLSVQFGALSGIRPEPVEEMAALVQSHRTQGQPVGEYQVFVRNLVYYTRFPQVELFSETAALDFLRRAEPVLLVVGANDLPRLVSVSGVTTRTLGQVRYLDPANIRLRTLLDPLPDQDLETVLLVTNR